MDTEEKLKSCSPALSPICNIVWKMHKLLRKDMDISYYKSSKDTGLRAEVIKRTEGFPYRGKAETLITLLEYYKKYFKGPFYRALIESYDIKQAGAPVF